MAQTSYSEDLAVAYEGMLADLNNNNDVVTAHSEEASSFPYGTAVVKGTADDQMLLPTGAALLLGITAHSHANEVGSDDLNLVDPAKAANVLHAGRIYVKLESSSGAVSKGDALFVRIANPAASPADEGLGRFRNDADAGDALAATGVRAFTSGTGGDVIVAEIVTGASIA